MPDRGELVSPQPPSVWAALGLCYYSRVPGNCSELRWCVLELSACLSTKATLLLQSAIDQKERGLDKRMEQYDEYIATRTQSKLSLRDLQELSYRHPSNVPTNGVGILQQAADQAFPPGHTCRPWYDLGVVLGTCRDAANREASWPVAAQDLQNAIRAIPAEQRTQTNALRVAAELRVGELTGVGGYLIKILKTLDPSYDPNRGTRGERVGRFVDQIWCDLKRLSNQVSRTYEGATTGPGPGPTQSATAAELPGEATEAAEERTGAGTGGPSITHKEEINPKERERLLEIKREIDPDGTYIGESMAILRVFEKIRDCNRVHDRLEAKLKQSGRNSIRRDRKIPPVLVLGETGTGKSTIAELIHKSSCRKNASFRRGHASTNPEKSEFALAKWQGYGRHSPAKDIPKEGQPGLLQECAGGTVFIDEVADIESGFQTLLLNILDSGDIPFFSGEGGPTKADVRLIFATNRDLQEEVKEGRFRHDLFERIRGNTIQLPPLSERREDVPVFVERFCEGCKPEPGFLLFLLRYDWPGNVRQLIRVLEKAEDKAIQGNRRLTVDYLEVDEPSCEGRPPSEIIDKIRTIDPKDCERQAYLEVFKIYQRQGLEKRRGLNASVAKFFKVSESTASRKLR